MGSFLFTLDGKFSFLDVYEDFSIARSGDRTSSFIYKHVDDIEFQGKKFLGDSFIRFTLNNGKRITFHLKGNKASQSSAESAFNQIKSLMYTAKFEPSKTTVNLTQQDIDSRKKVANYGFAEEMERKSKAVEVERTFEYREFAVKVAGVTFDNDDGTNRQDILRYLSEGDPVELVVEEYKGKPAVKIESRYGTIGYISKEMATEIANKIEYDIFVDAEVKRVYGGESGKHYGASIRITCKNQSYNPKKRK